MRIAAHLHLYYREQWETLLPRIVNLAVCPLDLYVTLPPGGSPDGLMLPDSPIATHFRVVENRGYDLGPFVETLNGLELDNYDFLVKLHTKRTVNDWINYRPLPGGHWRKLLLNFCASRQRVETVINLFERDPTAGMVADRRLIVGQTDTEERPEVLAQARAEIERFGLKPGAAEFVAGTMFIARARLFAPMRGKVRLTDFAPVVAREPATLAHVYERVLGYLVGAQGLRITDWRGRGAESGWPVSVRRTLFHALRGAFRAAKGK